MNLVPAAEAAQPVGIPARADLLPPEVEQERKGKRAIGNSIAAILLVIGLVVAGYIGMSLLTLTAQIQLAAAQERTQELLIEQGKYSEAQRVTALIAAGTAGREVVTATEIDWRVYLQRIQELLPAGTVITNFQAQTASPMLDFQQPSVPLQGDRIGQLSFTAVTPGLPEVEKWLISLRELPGFVDAAPGSVTLEDGGRYRVSITMHIGVEAYLNRFDPENPGTPGLLPGSELVDDEAAGDEEADEALEPDADADTETDTESEEG